MRGRLIVVEGIDGSGKTTMAARVAEELERRGRSVVRAREPGGTRIGERIREVLLDSRSAEMIPWTELFLYMASRAQLLDEVIRPALRRGTVVVLDRYYYSTAAYQGAAGGVGMRAVIELAERVARFERPNLVALLDLPPEVARRRRGSRHDRVERKGSAYQERVRRGFLDLARRHHRRFRVIDAARPRDEVFRDLWRAVEHAL